MPGTPDPVASGRRFELLRTLGVGAFGTVYLAEMESAGGFRRRVALKLLNPSWDATSDASTRLRDEARILGRLQHRHIVRVDDLLRLDGRWAVVMEYVEGVDLEGVVSPPQDSTAPDLAPRAALEVVAAVASALRAASDTPAGDGRPLAVVHRDIKPSNIRVTAQGELKVLDFGVARADFAGREAKTERVRYGSLGYMAPERLLGGDETSAGDIYALGVVLYELLERSALGRAELGPDAQAAQVEAAARRVEERAGAEVAALLRQMLAYDVDDRPSGAVVEARARALATGRDEPDLAAWCAAAVPSLGRALPEDGAVQGRVLAESDVAGRAIVNSATISLPADMAAALAGEPPPRTSQTLVVAPEPDEAPPPARPLRMAWVILALVVLGGIGGVGWIYRQSSAPPPAAAAATGRAPAPDPTAPEAPAPVAAPPEPAAPGERPPAPSLPEVPAPAAPAGSPARPRPPVPEAVAPEAPAPTPAPAAPVERLRSAKFVLAGSAERLDVACGDVRASGSGNALMQGFPAGDCTVSAAGATTTVNVQEPRKVDCTLADGSLQCR